MFALNDYLAGIALDQLSNQGRCRWDQLLPAINNGLMVNANGYTQRLPQLFEGVAGGLFQPRQRKSSLSRRSPWYAQMMDSLRKARRTIRRLCRRRCCRKFLYFQRVKIAGRCCHPSH